MNRSRENKRPQFLATDKGIKEISKFKRVKSLFCKHNSCISGIKCSSHGLTRISGTDCYTICQDCGKIISERHTNYIG